MSEYLNIPLRKERPSGNSRSIIQSEPLLESFLTNPKDDPGVDENKHLLLMDIPSIELYSTGNSLSIESALQEVSIVPSNGVAVSDVIPFTAGEVSHDTDMEEEGQMLKQYLIPSGCHVEPMFSNNPSLNNTSVMLTVAHDKNMLSDEMISRYMNHHAPSSTAGHQSSSKKSSSMRSGKDLTLGGCSTSGSSSDSDLYSIKDSDKSEIYADISLYPSPPQLEVDKGTAYTESGKEAGIDSSMQQVVIVTQDASGKYKIMNNDHSRDDGTGLLDGDRLTVNLMIEDGVEITEAEMETLLGADISPTKHTQKDAAGGKKRRYPKRVSKGGHQLKGSDQPTISKAKLKKPASSSLKQPASPSSSTALLQRPYKCSKCPARFADKEVQEVHELCHSDNKKHFVCAMDQNCGFTESNWPKMYNHLFKHGLSKPHRCKKCSFSCVSKSDLKTHAYVHRDSKDWNCHKCGRPFKHRRNLLAHLRQCSGANECGKPPVPSDKFKCQVCGKNLANKRNLDKHMEIHTDMKPFKCDQCGHRTRLKESLVMHMRKHTGERPFKCDLCDYSTPDKSSLRRHKRRHNNDKPYKCPHTGCDYRCIQKHCLETHIRRAHTHEQFLCEHCNYTTPNRYVLNQHLKQHLAMGDIDKLGPPRVVQLEPRPPHPDVPASYPRRYTHKLQGADIYIEPSPETVEGSGKETTKSGEKCEAGEEAQHEATVEVNIDHVDTDTEEDKMSSVATSSKNDDHEPSQQAFIANIASIVGGSEAGNVEMIFSESDCAFIQMNEEEEDGSPTMVFKLEFPAGHASNEQGRRPVGSNIDAISQ